MKTQSFLLIGISLLTIDNVHSQYTYSAGWHNFNTTSGIIQIGPANTDWAHIYTDRPNFIFNKDVYALTGGFSAYSTSNLSLKTAGITRMTVLSSNGNVGVGTITAPTSQLHVQTTGYPQFCIERINSGAQSNSLSINISGTPVAGLTIGAGSAVFRATNTSSVSDLLFMNGSYPNSPRFILKSNGNFGFGTDNPNSGFHIHQKTLKLTGQSGSGHLIFGGSSENAQDWGIEYNSYTSGKEGLNFWKPHGSAGGFDNYILFLGNNGNVGVGTNDPRALFTVNGECLIGDASSQLSGNYKLFVQTGILTEKVKIAVANSIHWADYVFEPTYKRMSLEDLESFVNLNKHLPNIPSALDVSLQGIDVADLSNRLLEKIEELTLYTIDQQKIISEMQKEIIHLQLK